MALEFRPPTDLVNAYLQRPSPGQIASEGINQAFQTYVQQKTQQEQRDFQKKQLESQDAQRKAMEFKAVADYVPEAQIPDLAKGYGINIPSAGGVPPAVSSGTAPTSMEESAQQSLPSEHSGVSPVVLASLDAGHPNLSGVQRPTSKTGLAKYKTGLETQKLEQDLAKPPKGPLNTVTKEGALKKGTFDPAKEIMVEPPAPRLDLSTRQDQFDQKEWDKIVKDTNPLTANTRTTLGMASKANFQADRALVTLSKPVVTNQEAGNVMADIAAIYQGGSPTQYGMSHQEYATLYGKVQGALQAVTGNPTDALPDAIKKRLVGVLHDMKGTNSLVLKQQLDFTEKAKRKIIQKFPDEWKDIRSTLEANPDAPGQNTIPVTGPHGASISQNGNIYNWNANTGQYE